MKIKALALLAALPLIASTALADVGTTPFSIAGSAYTDIWSITDSGVIVGSAGGSNGVGYGYFYDGSTLTQLAGPSGSVNAGALAMTSSGAVLGYYYTQYDDISAPETWLWQNGSYTSLSFAVAGGSAFNARAISSDGRYITGYYTGAAGDEAGFVYDLSQHQMVATLDDGGKSTTLLQGINSQGLVVGTEEQSGAPVEAFVYNLNTGTRSDYSYVGVSEIDVRAINNAGQIAGYLTGSDGLSHAFVGTSSGYQLISAPAGTSLFAEGLNDLGQVVGTGYWVDATTGNLIPAFGFSTAAVPVPEAPTLWMMSLGLVGLLVRRNQSAAARR